MKAWLRSDRGIAGALFVLALVAFSWFYGGAGWNQDSHFDLTRAIVERQTLHIDGYDVNTGDVSRGRDGHVYSNKAPGVSFLAAAPYAIIVAIEKLLRIPIDHVTRANSWIVTAATAGVCGAWMGPILYLYGRRRAHATPAMSAAVTLTILFGTIIFPYSTMLFAHVPSALFLLLSVSVLRDRPYAAGAAAAMSGACFYVSAVAAIALVITRSIFSPRTVLRFIAGAFPIALLLGLYHWVCFGSPIRNAVEASTSFTDKRLLLGVLGIPRGEVLYELTVSPYRGLFYASPILLVAILGIVTMARHNDTRHDLAAIGAVIVVFFIAIAAFNGWDGGWAFGPRYLLPVVPILGMAMLHVPYERSRLLRALCAVTLAWSFTVHFIATATDAMPSPGVRDPIGAYLMPAFFVGSIPEETRLAFPWCSGRRVENVALPRASGNLGELFVGEGRRASVAPILLWILGGSAVLIGAALRLERSTRLEEIRSPVPRESAPG
jgi:hypothetical protein